MEYTIIPDTAIVTVNRGENNCGINGIIYRDDCGKLQSIDFESCAANFCTEHENSTGNSIGERKIDEGYFLFYTGSIKTKIIFRALFVGNLFRHHFMKGTKNERFHRLQVLIRGADYTTFDLS